MRAGFLWGLGFIGAAALCYIIVALVVGVAVTLYDKLEHR